VTAAALTRIVALLVAWAIWSVPFFLVRGRRRAERIDRRARWGIVLEAVGFAFVWSQWAWTHDFARWRWIPAIPFLVLGPLLSWTSARALGRQWRFDAGLNADHELVRRGADRFVRHPIYASMFAMLLGTGALITRWRFLPVAIAFFVAGTEVRVRIEDGLLGSRFGETFAEYRRRVPAYIPFVR
jgi:protein-S-isoprenylcysteine O-methyltransferase Ste14